MRIEEFFGNLWKDKWTTLAIVFAALACLYVTWKQKNLTCVENCTGVLKCVPYPNPYPIIP